MFTPEIGYSSRVSNSGERAPGDLRPETVAPARAWPLCLINGRGGMRVYSIDGDLPPEAESLARFVDLSQCAELNDRLWDGRLVP